MPTKKPAKGPLNTANTKRFSLVPAAAQQQMYRALIGLKAAKPFTASGAEVAELAVCLAIGEQDPVILACAAPGARTVRKQGLIVSAKMAGTKMVGTKTAETQGGRLAAATISAVAKLFNDSKLTAVICAGKLQAQEDYRSAFGFAARHKLPILFLIANTLNAGQRLKTGTLYTDLGIPVFTVDAHDAIAAYRVATEALYNARHMRGPCVIEALTNPGNGRATSSALDLLRDYMSRHGNWPSK